MTRLRDLDVTPGQLPPGPFNAITDVPGVRVGHVTLVRGEGKLVPGSGPVRTGVTAILPHEGNLLQEKAPAAVYTINGYGKTAGLEQVRELGEIETPIVLTNTLNVGTAFDAVISYTLRGNPDVGIGPGGSVNPVVGETNDSFLNDIQGRHVEPAHVWQAIEHAIGGPVAEGNVGAGTGTCCFGFKGGIGSASRRALGFTVGALVQSNFGSREDLMVLGVPAGQHLADTDEPEVGPGSIMMVLATDAPLTSRQLERLAKRAAFGLARTGSICAQGSGDFAIAFSTAYRIPRAPKRATVTVPRFYDSAITPLFRAAIESIEEAVLNSLVAAETMTGRDGNTAHALPLDRLAELLERRKRSND